MAEKLIKTGEVMFRDENGALWLAESFEDSAGYVTTEHTLVEGPPDGIEP